MNKSEKTFFNDILHMSQNNYLEIRIMNISKKYWFSKYIKTIENLEGVLHTFDTSDYNIYYGTNVRPTQGRKKVDITTRRFFYWDIEHVSEKPKFSNESYQKELLESAHYISYTLEKKYGIKPSVLYVSGRGIHLGYSHYDLSMEYDTKFKIWYKQTQIDLGKNIPFAHIKCSDPISDAARIGGCPGTINYKYTEKPKREILHINPQNVCDLQNILDNFKVFIPKKKHKVVIKNGKYNEKNIFTAPEYKIFEQRIPEMKGYNIHSKLRVALILLMDKYNVQNREEVAQRIVQLGYWYESMVPIDNPDYVYSESILNNWCLDNWELCLQKGITIPYPFKRNAKYKFLEKEDSKDYEARELHSPWDVYYYVKNFNNATSVALGGERTAFYVKAMKENVLKNIVDKDLIKWLSDNKFLEKIKVVK